MEPVTGTLQFILATLAVVVGIVWAIDIPTTKWYGFKKPRSPTLLEILERLCMGTPLTRGDDATRTQNNRRARTYTEAYKRMQEREKARLDRSSSGNDPL